MVFDPWKQISYDENDTVLESLWYVERNTPQPTDPEPSDPDERAAWLTTAHADTPQITHTDSLGRPVVIIDDNGADGLYTMVSKLDIKGNTIQVTDAKGRQAFTYSYDMVNQMIKTDHLDNGTRYALGNVVGNPLRAFDSRQHVMRFTYDALQRPIGMYVKKDSDPEKLVSYSIFGEQVSNPQTNNLRGQPYMTFDQSGVVISDSFDFKGNPLTSQRRLALEYKTDPDWTTIEQAVDLTAVQNEINNLTSAEQHTNSITYDALNRPVEVTQPDSSTIKPLFDIGGALTGITTRLAGEASDRTIVSDIDYNARGQRKKIIYGNGSQTTYAYDNRTFRLTRLLTTKNTGADTLQDLNYQYDAVGNIVSMQDVAQEVIFTNNQQIDPEGKYVYDALYRLIKSQGREKTSLDQPPGPGDPEVEILPGAAASLRSYSQQYEYDELGNILQVIHQISQAGAGNWNRYYHYNAGFTNNYLLSTSTDNQQPTQDQYSYDAHGNMLQMPHLSEMGWDYADRLRSTRINAEEVVYYTYDAAGDRVRKIREKNDGRTWQRLYLGDIEYYREVNSGGTIEKERTTLHLSDDTGRICLSERETIENSSAQDLSASPYVFRYQLSNHLGSAALELDETAQVISYEEYYPFGNTSYWAGRSESEVKAKRYRYVGKEKDSEIGLYYYGARYYAAWLCRFVSVDPLKDEYPYYTSYQYAGNQPIIAIDIDGLEPKNEVDKDKEPDTRQPNKGKTKKIPSDSTEERGELPLKEGETLKINREFRAGYPAHQLDPNIDYDPFKEITKNINPEKPPTPEGPPMLRPGPFAAPIMFVLLMLLPHPAGPTGQGTSEIPWHKQPILLDNGEIGYLINDVYSEEAQKQAFADMQEEQKRRKTTQIHHIIPNAVRNGKRTPDNILRFAKLAQEGGFDLINESVEELGGYNFLTPETASGIATGLQTMLRGEITVNKDMIYLTPFLNLNRYYGIYKLGKPLNLK